ncbi:GMC family oxidoreductase [Aspergillus clavatus NRRL 1]|uniref:GMC oxidoreductase, putative n=1 Tax=Aspergillus clavatus (strain ATCC 1007 / CBS 513.65 / DSM 816 / NCTC 3887 / NRRL 1 / QM 1276 / 107) TaxID=344612 RepID=A1CJS6_ASPCL|nr:GMC oxidoreductase, putative [Aspergillus clavatus NRRL 1]EAW09400.1 GMC oxidoreductase, putative [Aspergillus clavatus NRRL 1]
MQFPFLLLSGLVGAANLNPNPSLNLLDDGQKGPLLGTFFGTPGANATYDYVIVGGGTAGLTIASRLAQNGSLSVAVVEAGGFYEIDNGNKSVVPGYAPFYAGTDPNDYQPLVDWGFVTTPQPGPGGRVMHYPRGKTLGGSSARNFMVYHRPTAGSLQRWADEVGDESYTFNRMLPYFQKSCHYTPPDPGLYVNTTNTEAANAFDPSGGPLEVSFSNAVDSFGTWAPGVFSAVGMEQIDGLNSGKLLGAAWATSTIKPMNAHRSSSESSFLQEAFKNGVAPTVYINAMAQRILFDSDKTATGVQVSTAGSFGTNAVNFTLNARKEIILSAGALQSPQLLMVSGIGACKELAKFGIDCINDLPGVGQNLQDHSYFGTSHRVNVPTASAVANNQTLAAMAVDLYLQNATGPLSIFGAGYYGWEKLPEPYRSQLSNDALQALSDVPSDWPEVEWLTVNAYFGDGANLITGDPLDGHNYATLNTAIVAPFSRGTVTLADASMNTPPVIDPQWLVDSTDMEVAIQAFKRQREVWDEFVKMGVADPEEFYPGKQVQTDAQIREHLRRTVGPVFHVSGSCKMGRRDDPMAVLDSTARVYGVRNLRVVDAGSFPFLTPGHPQATVYALAEKIADDILSVT